MRPTIYDVAKEANVSIATVSKVINNSGKMRDSTRERVQKAIKDLNYQPNMVASALTGKGTETMGLLVPDISNPFFSEMARMIENRAHEVGMSVIICSTDYKADKEEKYIELLKRKQVDGLIIAATIQNRELLKRLKEGNLPIVMLTQDDLGFGFTSVSVDDYKGGFEATNHLIKAGHEKIAIITEYANSSKMRLVGYREAHELHQLTVAEENIYQTTAKVENGQKIVKKMLRKNNVPTAVFACNDLIAIGVIKGAKEAGLNVPEDLSVVGFDDTILTEIVEPRLTSISQPVAQMGIKTVDLIIDKIDQIRNHRIPGSSERILFNPTMIIRNSTKSL